MTTKTWQNSKKSHGRILSPRRRANSQQSQEKAQKRLVPAFHLEFRENLQVRQISNETLAEWQATLGSRF